MGNIKRELSLDRVEFESKYGGKKIIAGFTLGCKTNQYETDAVLSAFRKKDYEVVSFDQFADVYIINTCTVTHTGDKKSRQMIRRAKKKNEHAIVIVMGCYAQISPDDVFNIEGVDIVLGTQMRNQLTDFVDQYVKGLLPKPFIAVEKKIGEEGFEDLSLSSELDHTRVFIKIQEGCNQMCTYCIIPYARGRVRSRDEESILSEIKKLASEGYKEFVLTGIHIASYGIDRGGSELLRLIQKIDLIQGVERLRLGSLEPNVIDDNFLEGLKSVSSFCPHFHLSLQSGAETVLKRMNRKYSPSEYEDALKKIREHFVRPAITTDVIVGFPGESNDEFQETMAFVEKMCFSEVHVFPYSKREGTPAAKMTKQVDESIKKQRVEKLSQLSETLSENYRKHFIGMRESIILEEYKNNQWLGYSSRYIKFHLSEVDQELEVGEKVEIEVLELADHGLLARLLKKECDS